MATTMTTTSTDQTTIALAAANVETVSQRTMGYIDTIRTCYETQQQITGDQVMTLLQKQGPSTVDHLQCLRGKVRDRYVIVSTNNNNNNNNVDTDATTTQQSSSSKIALVTTDRQSGFDRNLAVVPYKGAVLNLCSYYWFQQTKDIIANHILSVPHPNVSIAKQCQPFPIEFVVRYVFHIYKCAGATIFWIGRLEMNDTIFNYSFSIPVVRT